MIGNINQLSSRQKDNFIKELMKVSQSLLGDEGMSKTASVTVPTSALADKAEKAFSAIFQGPNGLKRVAFARL